MSTAYIYHDGEESVICDYVKEAKVTGGSITFIDIMGHTIDFNGTIRNVDLVNNRMLIEPAQSAV
jgi:predicted RNA-binding protein